MCFARGPCASAGKGKVTFPRWQDGRRHREINMKASIVVAALTGQHSEMQRLHLNWSPYAKGRKHFIHQRQESSTASAWRSTRTC
jgi:hypothetical protein